MKNIGRREFLEWMVAAGFSAFAASVNDAWGVQALENPLAAYPNRDWEKVYRDLWKYDSSFTFLCAPNDTHNCILNAFTRDGVVTRIGPTMKYGEATDLYGSESLAPLGPARLPEGAGAYAALLWRPPRCAIQWCARASKPGSIKDSRAKKTVARPRSISIAVAMNGCASPTSRRRISSPRRLMNIADTYSGEKGQKLLAAARLRRGDRASHPGSRHPGAQVPRRHAAARHDAHLRHVSPGQFDGAARRTRSAGVGPDKALGGRGFDNYSWHTDLPPGHPMVTGQQTVEFDLHAVEQARPGDCLGHELDHDQDAGCPLADRGPAEGDARWWSSPASILPPPSKADDVIVVRPGHHAGAGAGTLPTSSCATSSTTRTTCDAGPTCRCSCGWTP